jgi:sulfur relay (sulfurtransferase) DsrC/TusE family protein
MLLNLIMHSRNYLANVVRELSKCMDGASTAAYKEMIRAIRYVLDVIEEYQSSPSLSWIQRNFASKFENKNKNLNVFYNGD